jgi:2-phosphosulfolactate phosphatase
MRVDLFFGPSEIPVHFTKGRRVVIVDVLRACTSLTLALENGVEQIIPVDSVEEAKQLLSSLDRGTSVLAGEQEGMNLPGFDLGNSPAEFLEPGIAGKTVVYASPNGGPLLSRNLEALEKLLLSFVNVGAVVSYLHGKEEPELTVICAGHEGRFSLEDAVCAGMLLDRLDVGDSGAILNDGARAAWVLYRAYCDELEEVVRNSSQGRALQESGMEEDLRAAVQIDSVPLVPLVREGRIRQADAVRA